MLSGDFNCLQDTEKVGTADNRAVGSLNCSGLFWPCCRLGSVLTLRFTFRTRKNKITQFSLRITPDNYPGGIACFWIFLYKFCFPRQFLSFRHPFCVFRLCAGDRLRVCMLHVSCLNLRWWHYEGCWWCLRAARPINRGCVQPMQPAPFCQHPTCHPLCPAKHLPAIYLQLFILLQPEPWHPGTKTFWIVQD